MHSLFHSSLNHSLKPRRSNKIEMCVHFVVGSDQIDLFAIGLFQSRRQCRTLLNGTLSRYYSIIYTQASTHNHSGDISHL